MQNLRYLYHLLRANSARDVYWEFVSRRSRLAKLKQPEFAVLSRHVASEPSFLARALRHEAASPDDDLRLAAAVAWVLRAQRASPDAGASLGYFPLAIAGGWYPSYPETTGYLITTLLDYARRFHRAEARDAALAMAEWEIEIQMPSGAVQSGAIVSANEQAPAAFNTGMVLDGWCTAYEASREQRFLDAGVAAARFLVADMDEAGYFRTSGALVTKGETKTYNCLCAWAMLRLARIIYDTVLERAAVRAIDAALKRQSSNGWFANNCLTISTVPLTHTIGYALQGVFEVGVLAEREDFIAAAERGLTNALSKQRPNGFLAGRFDRWWNPAANFVCLTGSCQLALLAYRFAELFGKRELIAPADRVMSFVKTTQRLDSADANIIGAIAGSYPILGGYMAGGFPNWAAKFFIDALLCRDRLEPRQNQHPEFSQCYPARGYSTSVNRNWSARP